MNTAIFLCKFVCTVGREMSAEPNTRRGYLATQLRELEESDRKLKLQADENFRKQKDFEQELQKQREKFEQLKKAIEEQAEEYQKEAYDLSSYATIGHGKCSSMVRNRNAIESRILANVKLVAPTQ